VNNINDIDEGPYDLNDDSNLDNNQQNYDNRNSCIDVDDDEEDEEREKELEEARARENTSKRAEWARKEPQEHITCLLDENDSLEAELKTLRRELREAKAYKGRYLDAVLDLEDVREEAHMFLEQLESAELECQAASRREMAAMDVINQLSSSQGGASPAAASEEVLKSVREAADLVQKGYDLTGEYGYSLEDSVHLSNDLSVEYAHKMAYSAAIMVDKSGVFSQKYDQESQNNDLINRLESSLQKLVKPANTDAEDDSLGWFSHEPHEYPGRRSFESGVEGRYGGDREELHQLPQRQQSQHSKPRRPPPPPRHDAVDRNSASDSRHHYTQDHMQNFQPNIYGSAGGFADKYDVNGSHGLYSEPRDNMGDYGYSSQPLYGNNSFSEPNLYDNRNDYRPPPPPQQPGGIMSPITFGPRKKGSKKNGAKSRLR